MRPCAKTGAMVLRLLACVGPELDTPGRSVLPLLKAEPLWLGQEHGRTIPLRNPALLVAVQSDQKSGVFATGIGYS